MGWDTGVLGGGAGGGLAIIRSDGHEVQYASAAKATTHTVDFGFTAAEGLLLVASVVCDALIGFVDPWARADVAVDNCETSILYAISDGTLDELVLTCGGAENLCCVVEVWVDAAASAPLDAHQNHSANAGSASTGTTGSTGTERVLLAAAFGNDQAANYSDVVGAFLRVANLRSTGAAPNVTLTTADAFMVEADTFEAHVGASGTVHNSSVIATFKPVDAPV